MSRKDKTEGPGGLNVRINGNRTSSPSCLHPPQKMNTPPFLTSALFSLSSVTRLVPDEMGYYRCPFCQVIESRVADALVVHANGCPSVIL